jgi:hypothetical protein
MSLGRGSGDSVDCTDKRNPSIDSVRESLLDGCEWLAEAPDDCDGLEAIDDLDDLNQAVAAAYESEKRWFNRLNMVCARKAEPCFLL